MFIFLQSKEWPRLRTQLEIKHVYSGTWLRLDRVNPGIEDDKEVEISNDSNKIKLISVGRLSEQKGYDRLLRVFNKLNKVCGFIKATRVQIFSS